MKEDKVTWTESSYNRKNSRPTFLTNGAFFVKLRGILINFFSFFFFFEILCKMNLVKESVVKLNNL